MVSRNTVGKSIHDTVRRPVPLACSAINLIWLEHPYSLQFDQNFKTFEKQLENQGCYLFLCTDISECIKYLKRARFYERVVIVSTIDIRDGILKLTRYANISSILVLVKEQLDPGIDSNRGNSDLELTKIGLLTFTSRSELLERLDQLISELCRFDGTEFVKWNQQERSLHNLRDELGSFVWEHSYKG